MLLAAPAAAESVFEKLYPAGQGEVSLPTPFGALLDDIRKRSGGAEIQTAFVPLGRSLQRLAADPGFMQSPRIIVALTGEGEMPVGDRLYLGYQAAAGSIEVIAFDDAKGRFVFQEVTGYEPDKPGFLQQHQDGGCTLCHQAAGPIFAASPWSETNANPAVVAALPPQFAGASIKLDFDGIDLFGRSVRRAAKLQAAARIWIEGCQSRLCRAALLGEALRFKLAPDRADFAVKDASFMADLAATWPQGLALPSPKIPDRDPLRLVANGMAARDTTETEGVFNPETPRAEEMLWSSGGEGAGTAVQLVSHLLSQRQIDRLAVNLKSDDGDRLAADLRKIAGGPEPSALLDGALPEPATLEALLARAFASEPAAKETSQ